jgi:hypothetical protein
MPTTVDRRQSLRLPAYDYSQAGAYFIPGIVRGFKTFSARRVNERAGKRGVLWQRGYYNMSFATRKG